MIKLIKKIKPIFYLSLFSLFIVSFNFTQARAATVMSIHHDALTNKVTTIYKGTAKVHSYAAANYQSVDVSSLDDLKSQLSTAIVNHKDGITLNYIGDTALLSTVQAKYNSIMNDIMQSSGNDYEKVLYEGSSASFSNVSGNKFSMTVTFTYWETPDQSQQVTTKVTSVISQIITAGMTDEQKEKAINDYICSHIAYDSTLKQHSAYAGLFTGKTVCQGYALLAYRMLTTAGLPARIVIGTANGGGHAWNMVSIKDSNGNAAWYQLDTTWDDPLPDVIGRITYNYFNLTDTQLTKANHQWNKANYPAATTPYVTTDPDIINGGRKSDVVSPALNSQNNITVKNNYLAPDTVSISNLNPGDIVRIYKDDSTPTATATVTVPAGKTSVTINIPQLGATAGSIYVTVQNVNAFESTRTAVQYYAEPITASPDCTTISVINHVDKLDTVTIPTVAAKDVVSIYASDGIKKLISVTALKAGSLTVTLPSQLPAGDGFIYVTIKNFDKRESDKVKVNYKDAVKTADPVTISTINNVDKLDTVTVSGVNAGDVVRVYDSTGTSLLGLATALKDGSVTVNLPQAKSFSKTQGTVSVSVKKPDQYESNKVQVKYAAEQITDNPQQQNAIFTNNALFFVGLSQGDRITLYTSTDATAKPLATGVVLKGNTYVILRFKPLASGTKLYVVKKSSNMLPSAAPLELTIS